MGADGSTSDKRLRREPRVALSMALRRVRMASTMALAAGSKWVADGSCAPAWRVEAEAVAEAEEAASASSTLLPWSVVSR